MKGKIIGLVVGSGVLVFLLMLLVFKLVFGLSWWWFVGPLVFVVVLGLSVGIFVFVKHIRDLSGGSVDSLDKLKMGPDECVALSRNLVRFHEDNPDELVDVSFKTPTVGSQDGVKSVIGVLEGVGYNFRCNSYFVCVNMNEPNRRCIHMNVAVGDKQKIIESLASNPAVFSTRENVLYDDLGNVKSKTVVQSQTVAQKELEESDKRNEEVEGL